MMYDARCEVFSFGIVLLELVSGKLQGYEDADGQQIMLEDVLEEEGLLADHRIPWPEGLVVDILKVAGDCVASYTKRTGSMTAVMRCLVAINKTYHTLTPLELDLLRANGDLIARFESIQLQQDVRAMKEAEATRRCESCFDEDIPESKGIACSNPAHPHFFCGAEKNDCFGDMVTSQSRDFSNFVRNSSRIVCGCCTALVPRVISTFDASVIGRHASEGALAAFISANTSAGRHEGQAAMEDQRLRHAAEMQKVIEASIVNKADRMRASTARHRLHIIEKIITLHCPHCNLAILDFNGCFAVEHRADHDLLSQGCGRYFCGWCLAKFETNADCHSHVKFCPHNLHPGTYFGQFPAEFNRVHGERRRNLIIRYMYDKITDLKEREDTKAAIRGELHDIGIVI